MNRKKHIVICLIMALIIMSLIPSCSTSEAELPDTDTEAAETDDEKAESAEEKTQNGTDDLLRKAYLGILEENEIGIRGYEWQRDENYDPINDVDYEDRPSEYGSLVYLEDPQNKCVSIHDLNNDGTPELLFMSAESQGIAKLHICTFRDGEAHECLYSMNASKESVTERFEYVNAASGTSYMVYTGKKPGTLHIAHSIGDESISLTNNELELSDAGEVSQTKYVYNIYNNWSEDMICDDYYIDGGKVSPEEGSSQFTSMGEDFGTLIMFSGNIPELSVSKRLSTDTPEAMTYTEAVSFLQR